MTKMMINRARLGRNNFLIILLAGFVSQTYFYLAGGRMYLDWLYVMHFLDLRLLTNKLLESIWYMHTQPPLFNLFTGLGLKLFPDTYGIAFGVVFFLFSLLLAWIMFNLMIKLGVSRKFALAITILYQFSPTDIYYRNFYFYTYPVMGLLVISAASLIMYLSTRRKFWGWSFFILLATIILTRSTYHLLWFGVISVVLVIISNTRRRQMVKMAIIPALVCIAWMGKNHYLFGTFSMSSWMGWSMSRISTSFLSLEERVELINEGKLSSLATINMIGRYDQYNDYWAEVQTYRHPVEVLNQRYKKVLPENHKRPGRNHNYINWITISRQYARDAFAAIRYRPRAYLKGISISAFLYYSPTWPTIMPGPEKHIPPAYQRIWALFGGSINMPTISLKIENFAAAVPNICWLVVLFYISIPIIFLADFLSGKGFALWSRKRLTVIGFIIFNIIYISVTGIILDSGENNRFRAEIVPLTVVLAGVVLQRCLDHRRVKSSISGRQL